MIGFGCGVFASFLVYLSLLPAEEPGAETVATAEPESVVRETVPTPEYEFFEVLPSQRIEVDVDPAELPRNQKPKKQKLLLLQAGSFREAEDADRLRAELLLLGLEPNVEESHGETGRWYRVLLGPIASRSAMARARGLTAQQDIDTLLVQRDAG